jgi:hypothetical protein
MIAPTELTQNYERLNTPYDPNQPIELLFQQIQDARSFAVAGGQPYGAAMIVNVAYTLVFSTVLFTNACQVWQSDKQIKYPKGTQSDVWLICSGYQGPQGGKRTHQISRWRRSY